jgi:aspartate kinase
MKIFKFGGASVKTAEAIRNVALILQKHQNEDLVVILSAMGKMTNALEEVVDAKFYNETVVQEKLNVVINYHQNVIKELFADSTATIYKTIAEYFEKIITELKTVTELDYHKAYDQIVPYGEIISTKILSEYLSTLNLANQWTDATSCILCDNSYREAHVNWEETTKKITKEWENKKDKNAILVSQGFIASSAEGNMISLGREGSDFTAAIFAYVLDAEEVVVWKDVPGILNADPKHFPNTTKLDCISYNEAIELAYYGATVIHPKTIKPLENKQIPLQIRSFLETDIQGSFIHTDAKSDKSIPSYIFKQNQILLSITTRDFSFVAEKNLHDIFGLLAKHKIRSNLMQNSAISFSVCVDNKKHKLKNFIQDLHADFVVKYNEGLELITIRHYNEDAISQMTVNKQLLLEQRSRTTVQLVIKDKVQ